MPDKEKVLFNGSPHDAVRVHINQSQEPWSEYALDDGTILRRKVVATDILRIEGAYDANGIPIYVVHGQFVNDVRALPALRKKP